MDTTIAAICTAQGEGGIGVIRISGDDSLQIADKVFKNINNKKVADMKGYTAAFGKVCNNGEEIDEAVVLVYRAPHSYTGENVVEISCHGGIFITKQVLRAVLDNGAVPAQAGEFTKRAFLNGKIDLTEAESVIDIISAKIRSAARAALCVKDGGVGGADHAGAAGGQNEPCLGGGHQLLAPGQLRDTQAPHAAPGGPRRLGGLRHDLGRPAGAPGGVGVGRENDGVSGFQG